jgi:hypothetical protein
MEFQEHQLLVRGVPRYAGIEDFDVSLETERFARIADESGRGIGDRISEEDDPKEPWRFRDSDLVVRIERRLIPSRSGFSRKPKTSSLIIQLCVPRFEYGVLRNSFARLIQASDNPSTWIR